MTRTDYPSNEGTVATTTNTDVDCSTTVSYVESNLYSEKEEYEEDMFEEEKEWKKQQEKVVRFQSKIIPRVLVQPVRINGKRFKQKLR
jgi:hypothetical protein